MKTKITTIMSILCLLLLCLFGLGACNQPDFNEHNCIKFKAVCVNDVFHVFYCKCGKEVGMGTHVDEFASCVKESVCQYCDYEIHGVGAHQFVSGACIFCGERGGDGLSYRWDSNKEGYFVSNIQEDVSGDVIIPATHMGKPVKGIRQAVFSGNKKITSIEIPGSIEEIPPSCFVGCSSLKDVNLKEGVKVIYGQAFKDCVNLVNLTLPNSIEEIDSRAFSNCKNLKDLNLSKKLKTIGQEAFSYCESLVDVIIPNGVEEVANYSFANCSSLKSISIPNTVNSIKHIIDGCYSAEKIYYGGTVEDWLKFSFFNKESNPLLYASELYLNGSLLTECTLDSVSKIPNYAFYNCSSIEKLYLKDEVVEVGYYAFGNCVNLKEVSITPSVTVFGLGAFNNCVGLSKVDYFGDIEEWAQISFINEYNERKSSGSNPLYYAKNLYIDKKLVTEVVLTSATRIGAAFQNCISLTTVKIPDTVEKIGGFAFNGCSALTDVDLGNGVKEIELGAFSGCVQLEKLEIPSSVTIIGREAFEGCSKLEYTEESGVKYLGNTDNPYLFLMGALKDVDSVVINDSCKYVQGYAFSDCDNLEKVVVGKGVERIEINAFYDCLVLVSVFIPKNVKVIERFAFYKCEKLMIYCEVESALEGWHKNWCVGSQVQWGSQES